MENSLASAVALISSDEKDRRLKALEEEFALEEELADVKNDRTEQLKVIE